VKLSQGSSSFGTQCVETVQQRNVKYHRSQVLLSFSSAVGGSAIV